MRPDQRLLITLGQIVHALWIANASELSLKTCQYPDHLWAPRQIMGFLRVTRQVKELRFKPRVVDVFVSTLPQHVSRTEAASGVILAEHASLRVIRLACQIKERAPRQSLRQAIGTANRLQNRRHEVDVRDRRRHGLGLRQVGAHPEDREQDQHRREDEGAHRRAEADARRRGDQRRARRDRRLAQEAVGDAPAIDAPSL